MGLGSWLYNAGSSMVSGAVDGAKAIANATAETILHGAAVVNTGISKITDHETGEWAKTRVSNVSSALDTASSALGTAYDWTAETALPAVGGAVEWVVAATPLGYIPRGVESLTGTKLPDYFGGNIAEKHRTAEESMVGFAKFAWDDPKRAASLAGQGIINGVSSTVGMAGDIVHAGVYGYTLRPLAVSIYNLGMEEDKKANLLSDSAFFSWTEGLNKTLQIRNIPEGVTGAFGIEREGFDRVFGEIQAEVKDENGRFIPNPNANYERVLLYGPQVATEAVVFVAAGAVSFGTLGGALAATRITAVAAKIASTAKNVPVVGRVAKASENVKLTSRSLGTAEQAKQADIVHDVALAMEKIDKAKDKAQKAIDKAQDQVDKAKEQLKTAQEQSTNSASQTGTNSASQSSAQSSAQQVTEAEKALAEAEKALGKAKIDGQKQIDKVTSKEYSRSANLRRLKKIDKAGDKLDDAAEKLAEAEKKLSDAAEGTTEFNNATKLVADATTAHSKAQKSFDKLFKEGFMKDTFLQRPDVLQLMNGVDDMARGVLNAKQAVSTSKVAFTQAKKELKTIKRGGSADDIATAEAKLVEAEKAFNTSKETLKGVKEQTRIGLDGASREMNKLTHLDDIKESYKLAYYKSMQRWLSMRDHPVLEGSMIFGATSLGVYIDKKNTDALNETRQQARSQNDSNLARGLDKMAKDRNLFGKFNGSAGESEGMTIQNLPSLTGTFESENPASKSNGAISSYSSSGDRLTSNEFNNTSSALRTPLNDSVIMIDVTNEEAANIARSFKH